MRLSRFILTELPDGFFGMGDMMSLLEKAEGVLDRKKSEDFAKKALMGDGFSLEDFRDQLGSDQEDGFDGIDFEDAAFGRSICRPAAGFQECR